MAEIKISFRAKEDEKQKLIKIAKKSNRDMSKQILYWINRDYEILFNKEKTKEEVRDE